MDLIKKSFFTLLLLLVVVLVWVGAVIYFKASHKDVNPNAASYTKQIKKSFDEETLKLVTDKTEKSFSVSPSEFLSLTESSN